MTLTDNPKANEYLHSASINGVSGADYFKRKRLLWPGFWRAFGLGVPGRAHGLDLHGKRLLDVGCGHGAFVCEAMAAGADAVGIDMAKSKMEIGVEAWMRGYGISDQVATFIAGDAATYHPHKPFDVLISYETFEHMDNLPEVLNNLYRLLKPGGTFYASWGGIWPSVFGGHYWLQKYILGVPIPWSHRLFTKKTERPGVNQLGYDDYVRIIHESRFEIVSWQENMGRHWGYGVFRLLAKVPGLRAAFTQNFYVKLRRAE